MEYLVLWHSWKMYFLLYYSLLCYYLTIYVVSFIVVFLSITFFPFYTTAGKNCFISGMEHVVNILYTVY